jgi:NADH dehydrogenase
MILVTGGTGFVGSHLIKRLRQKGLPVRAVVRNPGKEQGLRDLGVEVVQGDVRDRPSLEAAARGCDTVVHLVGIIQEAPGQTFQGIHVEGTRNIVEASKKTGVRHVVYQSALGTRRDAQSVYHTTKWAAEEIVRSSGTAWTVLRPSLIYGPGDKFTIKMSGMLKLSPFVPVLGSGTSKVQPIYIDDVVTCLEKIVTADSLLNKVYEIGGPEQLTYTELLETIAQALGIRRPTVHLPLAFMKPIARLLEAVLPNPPVTTDQLVMLQEDNVCGMKDIREVFGVEPVTFREGLRRFLRP